MSDKIKPCPFCGGEGELGTVNIFESVHAFVRCQTCKAQTMKIPESIEWCANDKAIEAWNRRTKEDEQ